MVRVYVRVCVNSGAQKIVLEPASLSFGKPLKMLTSAPTRTAKHGFVALLHQTLGDKWVEKGDYSTTSYGRIKKISPPPPNFVLKLPSLIVPDVPCVWALVLITPVLSLLE